MRTLGRIVDVPARSIVCWQGRGGYAGDRRGNNDNSLKDSGVHMVRLTSYSDARGRLIAANRPINRLSPNYFFWRVQFLQELPRWLCASVVPSVAGRRCETK